jgi:hypothetical protein
MFLRCRESRENHSAVEPSSRSYCGGEGYRSWRRIREVTPALSFGPSSSRCVHYFCSTFSMEGTGEYDCGASELTRKASRIQMKVDIQDQTSFGQGKPLILGGVRAAADLDEPSPPAAAKPLVTVLVNSSLEQTYVGCIAGVLLCQQTIEVHGRTVEVQYINDEGDRRLCQCHTSGAEFRGSQHGRLIDIAMYEG